MRLALPLLLAACGHRAPAPAAWDAPQAPQDEQEIAPAPSVWTLDDVRQRARHASPQVVFAQRSAEHGQAYKSAARAPEQPEFRFKTEANPLDLSENVYDFTARFKLNNPFQVAAQVREQEATANGLKDRANATALAAERLGVALFCDVTMLRELVSRRVELLTALQRQVELAESAAVEGIIRPVEAESTRIVLLREATQLADSEGELAAAEASLRRLLSLPDGAPLELGGELPSLKSVDLSGAIATATQSSTKLAELRTEYMESEARARGAHMVAIPWFTYVEAGAEWRREDDASPVVGFGISVPLWTWGIAEKRRAQSEQWNTLSERAEIESEISAQLARDVASYERRRELLEQLNKGSGNLSAILQGLGPECVDLACGETRIDALRMDTQRIELERDLRQSAALLGGS